MSNASRDYYSFDMGTQDYLYNVANVYRMLNGDVSIRIRNEEIILGDEEKKLFALYLAAGIEDDRHGIPVTNIHFSDAYEKLYSIFCNSSLYKSVNENISRVEASKIISQEFSDLFSDLGDVSDDNLSVGYPVEMIVRQTLKVAETKEIDPIYQVCKMIDGSDMGKLTDSYVSTSYDLYRLVSGDNDVVLTRSDFEKKLIEKSEDASRDYYSFDMGTQDYLYNVANVYHMLSGNISMRIGNEEITLGDEGKKLFALYLAAGFNSVYDSKTKTMLHNSLAYREVYSRFGKSGVFKSKKENISQDEVSEIISQDFSELLNDRSNEFCNMKYLTIPALITMQTLKVAKSGEVNPIYWSCKMIDGSDMGKLTDSYVSTSYDLYRLVSGDNDVVLTRSDFEKKLIEKGEDVSQEISSDSHGVSSESDKKDEIVSSEKVQNEAIVDQSPTKDEMQVGVSKTERWQKANQVVNDFLKEIIPKKEWRRMHNDGAHKTGSTLLRVFKRSPDKSVGIKDVDTTVSHEIGSRRNSEMYSRLVNAVSCVSDASSTLHSRNLLGLIEKFGDNYYPRIVGVCILADCVQLYEENGCDLDELLYGYGEQLAKENIVHVLNTIKEIERMPRKSLDRVASISKLEQIYDKPIEQLDKEIYEQSVQSQGDILTPQEKLNQHEQIISETVRDGQQRLNAAMKPFTQDMVATLDKLLTQQGYDTSKFRTGTAGFRPGTSDLGEMGKMFGDKSIGDTSKSDDKGRHL